MTSKTLDWTQLGHDARVSALDAHDGVLPTPDTAYSFMLDNPECFMGSTDVNDEWPGDMPTEPNIEFLAAYFGAIVPENGKQVAV